MALNYLSFRPDPDYLDEDEISGGYGWFQDATGNETYGADADLARQLIAKQSRQTQQTRQDMTEKSLPDLRLASLGSAKDSDAEVASDTPAALDTNYDQLSKTKAEADNQGQQGPWQGSLLEQENAARAAEAMPPVAALTPPTPEPASQLSEAGRERLKLIESGPGGPQLEPYQDAGGVWTVGYGDTHGVEPGKAITPEEAEQRFDDRTGAFTRGVLGMVKVPLSQNQLDALVSVSYNTGLGGLEKSDIVKRLNAGDYEGAGEAIEGFRATVKGKPHAGLEQRRQRERALFEGGEVPASQQQAPAQPGAAQMTPSPLAGLRPAQVQVQGIPKTPQEIAAQQAQTAQTYDQVIADAERARDDRVKARTDAATRVQAEESARQTQAFLREQRALVAQEQAQQKIDAEVAKPIEKVDPKRLISGMSTGQKLLGALAAILGGAGAALTKGPNYAMGVMQSAIDADIDAQKEDIRSGRARTENRLAHWTRQLGNAQSGELAARAEYNQATLNLLKAQDVSVETADIQAQHAQVIGQLELNKNAAIQQLKDIEANRYVTQYQPPVSALTGPIPVSKSYDPASDDPALSAGLAREFSALPPKQQEKQLNDYGKEMSSVDQFGTDVNDIVKLYGAAIDPMTGKLMRNAQGQAVDKDGKPIDFVSSATGIDPFDAWDERDSAKARRLTQKWDKIRMKTREGWKTEPNGQVWQERLSGVDIPKLDEDVPNVLDDLLERQAQLRKDIRSQYAPQVRGYYAQQRGPTNSAPARNYNIGPGGGAR